MLDMLTERARTLLPAPSDVSLNRRQREILSDCLIRVRSAMAEPDPVLAAEELRGARTTLDRLTGQAGTDEMLAALFGRFCVGK